jgi:hypothetical protein
MKFSIKIDFLKFRGTGYLLAKNNEELKCIFKANLKIAIYIACFLILVLYLSIQSFHTKKYM